MKSRLHRARERFRRHWTQKGTPMMDHDDEAMRLSFDPYLRESVKDWHFEASAGPATATECSRFVDASRTACSWHLRILAKAEGVESMRSANGRERPWRYVADESNTLAPEPDNPVTETVEASLLAWGRRMEDAFLRRRSALPRARADAAEFNVSVLWAWPAQLKTLAAGRDAPGHHPDGRAAAGQQTGTRRER